MTIPETTAVIGAGTMGPGIAATLSRCGSAVRLNDVDESVLGRAKGATDLAAQVLGRLDAPSAPGGSVSFEPDLEKAVAGANLVIEAVPEKLELKREVFAKFEQHVSNETILATNTSGIPISDIAVELKHPERIIGMHWSNPPHLIPMIEVIPGEHTAPEAVEALTALIRRTGHRPILIRKDVPGFVENRVLYAIMRECLDLVEKGVISPADLDACVSWGIGYKLSVIGPMALLDMAGLDIYAAVSRYLNKELSNRSDVAAYI